MLIWMLEVIENVMKNSSFFPKATNMEPTSVFSHRSVCLSDLTGVALGAPLRYEGALAIRSVMTRQTVQTTFLATKMIKMVAAFTITSVITNSRVILFKYFSYIYQAFFTDFAASTTTEFPKP